MMLLPAAFAVGAVITAAANARRAKIGTAALSSHIGVLNFSGVFRARVRGGRRGVLGCGDHVAAAALPRVDGGERRAEPEPYVVCGCVRG